MLQPCRTQIAREILARPKPFEEEEDAVGLTAALRPSACRVCRAEAWRSASPAWRAAATGAASAGAATRGLLRQP
jgi:hypothetical protein